MLYNTNTNKRTNQRRKCLPCLSNVLVHEVFMISFSMLFHVFLNYFKYDICCWLPFLNSVYLQT